MLSRRPVLFPTLVAAASLAAVACGQAVETSGETSAARTIDEILTRLQRRSDGLSDIRSEVRYVEDDRINLTQRTKLGSILFLITKPNPHFLVYFEKTAVDGLAGRREWYLFDGRWLYEAVERLGQVTKREVALEGEKVDLFDLEQAPFPLPFGQKKDTILRNFHVELIPPAKGDPPDTDHLQCVPKPDSPVYTEYDRLDFFIHRGLHLPTRVVMSKNKGLEVSTADFPDLSEQSINAGVTKQDFALPKEWKDYRLIVEAAGPARPGGPDGKP